MRFLKMYAPILTFVAIALGWLVVAHFDNYFLSLLYPLYAAILLSGFGIIKYQYRDLANHSSDVLQSTFSMSIKLFGIELLLCMSLLFTPIAWELILILILFMIIHGVRLYTLWSCQRSSSL